MVFKIFIVASLLLILTACATTDSDNKSTLYEQLGAEQGLNQLTDELVNNIGSDQRIFHYFADANVTRFKKMLKLHLCEISDGPCIYEGDSMQTIHDGMKITEKDFNHLVDLLIDAMNKSNIPHPIQNKLLARLAPLRTDIIYR